MRSSGAEALWRVAALIGPDCRFSGELGLSLPRASVENSVT